MKNGLPSPGQDKDTVTTVQKVSECNQGDNVFPQDKTVLQHMLWAQNRNNQTISIMIVLQGAQSKGGRVKSGTTRNTSKLSR